MGWMRRFEQEWTDEERAEFDANCAAMKAGNLAASHHYSQWFEWMIAEPVEVEETGDGLRIFHDGILVHDDAGSAKSRAIARFYRGDA